MVDWFFELFFNISEIFVFEVSLFDVLPLGSLVSSSLVAPTSTETSSEGAGTHGFIYAFIKLISCPDFGAYFSRIFPQNQAWTVTCSDFAGGKSGGDPGACDQTPCCNAAFSRYQGAGRCPDSQESRKHSKCCMSMSMCVAPFYIRMFIVRSQTCRISWCCCMPIREVLKDVTCDAVMVPLGIYQPPANAAGLCWAWDCKQHGQKHHQKQQQQQHHSLHCQQHGEKHHQKQQQTAATTNSSNNNSNNNNSNNNSNNNNNNHNNNNNNNNSNSNNNNNNKNKNNKNKNKNNSNSNSNKSSSSSSSGNSRKPTAHSQQPTRTAAPERTQGESSPRPFGCGVVVVLVLVVVVVGGGGDFRRSKSAPQRHYQL